jgi:hypothetical protein
LAGVRTTTAFLIWNLNAVSERYAAAVRQTRYLSAPYLGGTNSRELNQRLMFEAVSAA